MSNIPAYAELRLDLNLQSISEKCFSQATLTEHLSETAQCWIFHWSSSAKVPCLTAGFFLAIVLYSASHSKHLSHPANWWHVMIHRYTKVLTLISTKGVVLTEGSRWLQHSTCQWSVLLAQSWSPPEPQTQGSRALLSGVCWDLGVKECAARIIHSRVSVWLFVVLAPRWLPLTHPTCWPNQSRWFWWASP